VRILRIVSILSALFCCLLFAGCGGGGSNPAGNAGLSQTGEATLNFNLMLPDGKEAPISSIRASSNPQVEFEVGIIQPGNTSTPVSPIRKTVEVLNREADVTFSNLPLKPVYCKVSIIGGNKDGYSKFRGALRLTSGNNTANVMPEGSKTKEDLLAGVLEALANNPTEFAKISDDVISRVEAAITDLVGTDITDEMAMMTFANPITDTIDVPAERTVSEALSEHTTQVKVAVKESLTTALEGFKTSVRASTNTITNPVPAGVPLIGNNGKTDIGSMLQFLPSILPGGSDAVDMPIQGRTANNATRTLIIEYTNDSIKYKKYGVRVIYDFMNYKFDVATNSVEVITLSGINVETKTALNREREVEGNYISRISGGSDWQGVIENLDPVTETLNRKLTITPESGFSFDITYDRTYEVGTYTIDSFSWGGTTEHRTFLDYYARVNQKSSVTFSGTNKISATLEEPGQENSNFWISFEGLTGSFIVNQTGFIGWQKNGQFDTVENKYTYIYDYKWILDPNFKKYFMPLERQNFEQLPVFSGNQLVIKAQGNYFTEGFELQDLKVTLPNITKLANPVEGHPADYTSSGGTANAVLKYTGTQPELYGYIRMLQVAVSDLSYDSVSNQIGDGTQYVFSKTSTDGTNNVLTYKMVNGKAVLQPVTQNFTGGSETVSSDGSTTTIEGTVAVKGSDSTTVNLEYNTNKSSDGSIAVKVDLQIGGSTQTIFFNRDTNGTVTGRFYLTQKTADDSQSLLAQFTIYSHGMGMMTYAEGSGHSGSMNFYMDL
jgi:hypothetical protein